MVLHDMPMPEIDDHVVVDRDGPVHLSGKKRWPEVNLNSNS